MTAATLALPGRDITLPSWSPRGPERDHLDHPDFGMGARSSASKVHHGDTENTEQAIECAAREAPSISFSAFFVPPW
jgi:hypothetical protein